MEKSRTTKKTVKPAGSRNNSSRRPSGASSTGRPNAKRTFGKRAKKVTTMDPKLLVQKAQPQAEVTEFVAHTPFSKMPLNQGLKANIEYKGYINPSEIQEKTFDALVAGKDVLGIAQTGTGKTAAFLIPTIEQLLARGKNNATHTLIVVPTRELASQVSDEFKSLTKGMRLFSNCFIGGNNINKDIQALRRDSHIIIGTPGRLLDLMNRKVLNLHNVDNLVLDEFDRMLDMGFVRDVKKICYAMQNRKQTLLFSATLDGSQKEIIDWILTDPLRIQVSSGNSAKDSIDQEVIEVASNELKFKKLTELLKKPELERVLVFDETKRGVSRLCMRLKKEGIPSGEIHGDRTQKAREKALLSFKTGHTKVLVATDVAARGIDVSDVTHVINYQIPRTYDSYIHRIGRTGRAGKAGQAYTFVIK